MSNPPKLTPGQKKMQRLKFLQLIHTINKFKKSKNEKRKKELEEEFAKKCQLIEEALKKEEKNHKAIGTLLMYAMNNVWWAVSRLPWRFLRYFMPCVYLGQDETYLWQQITSLPPSKSKTLKLIKLAQFATYEECTLGYIARSNDIRLFDKVLKKVYPGNWLDPDLRVPSILDWLAEAITNGRPVMVNHLLTKAEKVNIDLGNAALARFPNLCENPKKIFLDFENMNLLAYPRTADRLRKLWNIPKSQLELVWSPSPEIAAYILDDPIPHPDIEKARIEWKKEPTFLAVLPPPIQNKTK